MARKRQQVETCQGRGNAEEVKTWKMRKGRVRLPLSNPSYELLFSQDEEGNQASRDLVREEAVIYTRRRKEEGEEGITILRSKLRVAAFPAQGIGNESKSRLGNEKKRKGLPFSDPSYELLLSPLLADVGREKGTWELTNGRVEDVQSSCDNSKSRLGIGRRSKTHQPSKGERRKRRQLARVETNGKVVRHSKGQRGMNETDASGKGTAGSMTHHHPIAQQTNHQHTTISIFVFDIGKGPGLEGLLTTVVDYDI
ncbi:hypothetical protein DFJ77DRAFT_542182 [Powellomyces hirtus]|nr:hypothetical protein DFJ77DRAFT_542182 [Powellomyces hirtus]